MIFQFIQIFLITRWLNFDKIFKITNVLFALSPLSADTYECNIKFNKCEFEYHFRHMNYLKINYRISDLDLENLTQCDFRGLGSIKLTTVIC